MNFPNLLSFFRLFIGPVIMILYVNYEYFGLSMTEMAYIILGLGISAELSDYCDGLLARRFHQITNLGKILDPMTDTLYHLSVFVTFIFPPISLHPLLILILLYRDYIITNFRTVCAFEGMVLAARPSGKIKATMLGVVSGIIVVLLIVYSYGNISLQTLTISSNVLVGFAALYSMASGFEYLYAYRSYVKKTFSKQE